jgi:hypothetical protein
MSILSSVKSNLEPTILEPISIPGTGVPREDCKPADDCGDDKQSKWNDDHKGRDDYSKHAKNDDDHKGRDDDHKGDGDHSKHAKNDDCQKDGKGDYSNHDGGWKDAKNDDCQPHKDYCQPQKDYCDPNPSDDCGKGDTSHNVGEALAKFDFSHGDLGSHGPNHSGDMQGALASMSSDHALDYAISQMGSADHFDVGHFDVPASHDMVHDA